MGGGRIVIGNTPGEDDPKGGRERTVIDNAPGEDYPKGGSEPSQTTRPGKTIQRGVFPPPAGNTREML